MTPKGLWSSIGTAALGAVVAVAAYLLVMAVADRRAMTALRERGRARRRGGA